MRRIRPDREGREIIIIDNSYGDPRAVGGFYVDLPPPMLRIPYNRYIVEADDAPPDLIYDTMMVPPVERIERRYSHEIRYSLLRQRISIINSINFDTGSWTPRSGGEAAGDRRRESGDRAIRARCSDRGRHRRGRQRRRQSVAVGPRAAVAARTADAAVPGAGGKPLDLRATAQYLKEQTAGPSRINRRVTIRHITPLLNGGTASLPRARHRAAA